MNRVYKLVVSLVGGLLALDASAGTVFDFDSDAVGTATSFTDTVNGLSATFSSPADPGGFVIYANNGLFATLTGNVLGTPGPAGQDNLPLSVGFSQGLSSISLDFATSDFITPSPLTLSAYENATLVGSVSAAGQFIGGFSFPEGQISFGGAIFNSVVISSTATDFAIDNVTATPVPTPPTLWLLLSGMGAFGLPALRRRIVRMEQEIHS